MKFGLRCCSVLRFVNGSSFIFGRVRLGTLPAAEALDARPVLKLGLSHSRQRAGSSYLSARLLVKTPGLLARSTQVRNGSLTALALFSCLRFSVVAALVPHAYVHAEGSRVSTNHARTSHGPVIEVPRMPVLHDVPPKGDVRRK